MHFEEGELKQHKFGLASLFIMESAVATEAVVKVCVPIFF